MSVAVADRKFFRLAGVSQAIKTHWPEYLMEAAGLGTFMLSAVLFTALLEHPVSPLRAAITHPVLRRILIGIAMGVTAIGIIYSPWGKQSGAHLNPSVTLTFFRMGKLKVPDACGYVLAQFAGGLAGVLLGAALIGPYLKDPAVNYAVTVPGPSGPVIAFVAELAISAGLMLVVLIASNSARWNRWTGIFAGVLVATYIAVEAPLSGMSMNPARTVASALPAHLWTDWWIYFAAPPLGMLAASELCLRFRTAGLMACPKLHHDNPRRCIFCGKS
ncbi:MAG: aquaporin [Nitrospirota bacterium]